MNHASHSPLAHPHQPSFSFGIQPPPPPRPKRLRDEVDDDDNDDNDNLEAYPRHPSDIYQPSSLGVTPLTVDGDDDDAILEGEPDDDDAGSSDPYASLTSQALNPDGTPKRPMNAFMIFARQRRPQVSAEHPSLRTGEISKILSKEWQTMAKVDKQFYLEHAKKLKDTFNTRWPDYVYKRRPNNSRKRRKNSNATRPDEFAAPMESAALHDPKSIDGNDPNIMRPNHSIRAHSPSIRSFASGGTSPSPPHLDQTRQLHPQVQRHHAHLQPSHSSSMAPFYPPTYFPSPPEGGQPSGPHTSRTHHQDSAYPTYPHHTPQPLPDARLSSLIGALKGQKEAWEPHTEDDPTYSSSTSESCNGPPLNNDPCADVGKPYRYENFNDVDLRDLRGVWNHGPSEALNAPAGGTHHDLSGENDGGYSRVGPSHWSSVLNPAMSPGGRKPQSGDAISTSAVTIPLEPPHPELGRHGRAQMIAQTSRSRQPPSHHSPNSWASPANPTSPAPSRLHPSTSPDASNPHPTANAPYPFSLLTTPFHPSTISAVPSRSNDGIGHAPGGDAGPPSERSNDTSLLPEAPAQPHRPTPSPYTAHQRYPIEGHDHQSHTTSSQVYTDQFAQSALEVSGGTTTTSLPTITSPPISTPPTPNYAQSSYGSHHPVLPLGTSPGLHAASSKSEPRSHSRYTHRGLGFQPNLPYLHAVTADGIAEPQAELPGHHHKLSTNLRRGSTGTGPAPPIIDYTQSRTANAIDHSTPHLYWETIKTEPGM